MPVNATYLPPDAYARKAARRNRRCVRVSVSRDPTTCERAILLDLDEARRLRDTLAVAIRRAEAVEPFRGEPPTGDANAPAAA